MIQRDVLKIRYALSFFEKIGKQPKLGYSCFSTEKAEAIKKHLTQEELKNITFLVNDQQNNRIEERYKLDTKSGHITKEPPK